MINKTIRRDLFAVKVLHNAGWCYEKITKDKRQAINFRDFMQADHHRDCPLADVEIVHPAQWIVDTYLAYGNTIQ